MNEFLDRLSEILEVAASPDLNFRTVEGWSSLMGFSILVMLENDYGHVMPADDFLKMETVADLARAVGVA